MLILLLFIASVGKIATTKVSFLPINWTEVARIRTVSNGEYSHSFEDFQNSACDLTVHTCDVYCCNDPDCTCEQIQNFQCLDLESDVTLNLKSLDCDQPSYWTPQWFSLFCYVSNNSAVLGYHYTNLKMLENEVEYHELVSTRRLFSFSDSTVNDFSSVTDTERVYVYGSSVQVFIEQFLEITPLELPFPSIKGFSCTSSFSIPFLIDNSWTCKHSITAEACNSSPSPFDLLQYALGGNNDSFWQSIDVFPPKIIRSMKDKTFAEINVNFMCLKNGTDYVNLTRNIFNLTKDLSTLGYSQIKEAARECKDMRKLVNTYYEIKEEICQNVLVGLELEFEWSGADIVKLNVQYVLADLLLSYKTLVSDIERLNQNKRWVTQKKKTSRQNIFAMHVTQTFKINYKRSSEGLGNIDVAENKSSSMRSGNPGYLTGKAILSGNLRINLPEGNLNGTINDHSISWERSRLSIWGNDGFCNTGRPVLFGVDASSTCALNVTLEEFDDCSGLRERVRQVQESLVAATWVTRGGDLANLTSASSLVPILRRQENGLEGESWRWTWSDRQRRSFRLASSVTFTRIPTPGERNTNRFWLDLPKDSWFHAVRMLDFSSVNTKTIATVTPAVLAVAFLLCRRTLMGPTHP